MRDVSEVHTAVCRHVPSAFLCGKGRGGGGSDVRERSEFPQYQTYQRDVSGGCGGLVSVVVKLTVESWRC